MDAYFSIQIQVKKKKPLLIRGSYWKCYAFHSKRLIVANSVIKGFQSFAF